MRYTTPFQYASPFIQLLRRLYAWAVDTLLASALLGAVLLLAHLLLWGLMQAGVIAAGEELSLLLAHSGLFVLLLGALLCGYFLWFWCRSGQTPGLLLAGLELQSADGSRLKVGQAIVRLATSAFGLGNLMVLFDTKQQSFQDYWAQSKLIDANHA
ncbi:MAG: RDD family protein [Aeromonadaceae bacterium]|nr:RDD family protein [Aeromonadaceae bacterium]